MTEHHPTFFAPQLYIPSGVKDIDFYVKAFGAVLLMKLPNDDGSIHVAELSINEALFHLHEDNSRPGICSPLKNNSTTVLIGLFVTDVDAVVQQASGAGAKVLSPPTDYDYGYRQAVLEDPFGHRWMIEMKIRN